MNNLAVLDKNNTLNSREVAEMVEKRHSDLLRDIETYIRYINQNAKLRSDDFFSESTYQAGTGKDYKCYEITKMGCEMIANKLTGAKGIQFTALFVQKFNKLEENEKQTFYIPGTYAEALTLAAKQAELNEQLMLENEVKTQTIAEYEPKVSYYDQILKSPGLITVTQIAADYDLTAHKLNKILYEEQVQHKVGGQWILYKKHMNLGLTKSETVSIVHSNGRLGTKVNTKWTQKGRLFIHEILEKVGIQAVIDKDI
ncbi:Rha family transcriptional regulator [Listeria welshimeri]|uniref:Rha family transcriptional regulator n=1 Tax=Listeria welshimeri TaxID=1643 RepID=UPI0010EDF282|nr:phage antirepressor KilAC domain-containing protein [Listeria welshimeri]EAE7099197.1 Rha family transcriptional regulator [Listeria monocytogenes]EAE9328153.1 Rha family transcriptional regulator [Listeria monocytogenes]EAF3712813.1 Rha family transcriptional regulator [Listeria monocytogenes]EAF6713162.1 Rha family transcriptional regulator [Listeria monocytogenes]EAG2563351.1 Rha family transcriptional regulator [Listeria monocytogenes]